MLVSYPCNVVPFWLANLRARYFTIKPLSGGSTLWSIATYRIGFPLNRSKRVSL